MQRIDIKKIELEKFFDSLKTDFDRLSVNIYFNDFKKYFCDDSLFINKSGGINIELCQSNKCKKIDNLKDIYTRLSSDNSKFFLKLRELIIITFTEQNKFCPYCGKSTLIYFERGKDKNNSYQRLFQFDHFFPKNTYHTGIINFYNLIPSCNSCNHLKSDDNPLNIILEGGVIFHPYFGNLYLDNDKILRNDESKNADIRLNYISQNSKFWKLGKKYLNAQDTFNEFDFMQDKRTKIKALKGKFKNTVKTDEQFKEYFFKNYYPQREEDILKYSNGKLKKDLIENLKL